MMSRLSYSEAISLLIREQINTTRQENGTAPSGTGCTIEICPVDSSRYDYRISLIATLIFVSLFGGLLINFLGIMAITRRALAFNLLMATGTALELLGYIGRLLSWYDQWKEWPYLMQICLLTIAPAFPSAAIYLCPHRIIEVFSEDHSPLNPRLFTRIFIPLGVVSLLLQAAGGAIASTASKTGDSSRTGQHIMVAGLGFQALTLLAFMSFSLFFVWNCWRNRTFNRKHAKLRADWRFKGFIVALAVATFCIFARSVFRVAELSQGWRSVLTKNQILFVLLEGTLVTAACLGLNLFNPSFIFENDRGWVWPGKSQDTYFSRSPSPKSLFSDSVFEDK